VKESGVFFEKKKKKTVDLGAAAERCASRGGASPQYFALQHPE
jgi:hypothetical protein